jgi:hypothetical protein
LEESAEGNAKRRLVFSGVCVVPINGKSMSTATRGLQRLTSPAFVLVATILRYFSQP